MGVDLLSQVLGWIEQNPVWAQAGIFLIAFGESLALVGLFMPGAILMFGIGALVGTGHLHLLPTLAAAALGAIAGDGISFWLGYRFRDRIRLIWPFRRHPEWIGQSSAFFHRHGGKSVLFARFVGPVRPVLPAVAGMMGMPPSRFLAINISSGLLWAPAYTLPGAVFGASIDLAAEVAVHLVMVFGLLLAALIAVAWLVRRLYDAFHPRAHRLIRRVLQWSRLHPVLGEVPAALLDPTHPEARGLTALAALLILANVAFFAVVNGLHGGGFAGVDTYLFHQLQNLRQPAADAILIAITQLGDGRVLTALFVTVLLWLAAHRHWQAVGHWIAAGAFGLLATQSIKWATGAERPMAIYDGISRFSFPSGHVTHSLVIYGFLAVLVGRELTFAGRRLIYSVAALLTAAVAFSRLYLGAHWLSDVLGGMALGLAWVSLLGIAYQRHRSRPIAVRRLVALAAFALLAVTLTTIATQMEPERRRYAPQTPLVHWSTAAWWDSKWQELPAVRSGLGEIDQPLALQYAGDLDALSDRLEAAGWRRTTPLDAQSWLRWFAADAAVTQLPLLPQVHDGQNEALTLIGTAPGEERRFIALRFWRSKASLSPLDAPIWLGAVSYIGVARPLGLLSIPRTLEGWPDASILFGTLGSFEQKRTRRTQGPGGEVLLLRSEATDAGIDHRLQAGKAFHRIGHLQQVLLVLKG